LKKVQPYDFIVKLFALNDEQWARLFMMSVTEILSC